MKCQVCEREHGTLLSICPACGAMMDDTVREELAAKISLSGNLRPTPLTLSPEASIREKNPYRVPPPAIATAVTSEPPRPKKSATAELRAPKTSQTLVEFQQKGNQIPEWRVQMQNAVRARRGSGGAAAATAMKAEAIEAAPMLASVELATADTMPESAVEHADPRLQKALKRIAESREQFSDRREKASGSLRRPQPPKPFKFDVVAPRAAVMPAAVKAPAPIVAESLPKPILVTPAKVNTSKLPKLDEAPAELTPPPIEEEKPLTIKSTGELAGANRIFIPAEKPIIDEAIDDEFEDDYETIEDLAPFAMRFNAGLFDLIISAVAAMVILSPFAFSNAEWFSLTSVLIFGSLFALTTFVYSTFGLGFYGRTLGMKIFSLEIVDVEENEYPTLAQAAAHSALFIPSVALFGAGFIAMLFNEEKRAAHDLLSGTIVVRQF